MHRGLPLTQFDLHKQHTKGWYKVATHFVSIMPRTHSRFPSEKRFLQVYVCHPNLTAEQPHERCHITGGSKPLLALPA